MAIINGTSFPDVVPATESVAALQQLAGDDIITLLDGNDIARGADGNDLISGGPDNDRLFGNRGQDTLQGDEGDDELHGGRQMDRSEEHTSELQSLTNLVCRLLLEKKKQN